MKIHHSISKDIRELVGHLLVSEEGDVFLVLDFNVQREAKTNRESLATSDVTIMNMSGTIEKINPYFFMEYIKTHEYKAIKNVFDS